MRNPRSLAFASIGLFPLAGIACGHDEPPATAPIIAPAAAQASPSAAPLASSVPTTTPGDAGGNDTDAAAEANMWGDSIGDSFGAGAFSTLGRGDGGAAKSSPSLRQGTTSVSGRLPPEVIQRIVRQNFGRFRLCYENGLRTKPDLQGRISVKFTIDGSGAVTNARDGGSDLPDKLVVSCVVRGFSTLSFPQPEGGIVVVVYPIIFTPADAPPAKAPAKK